jgi:hypothetical protein
VEPVDEDDDVDESVEPVDEDDGGGDVEVDGAVVVVVGHGEGVVVVGVPMVVVVGPHGTVVVVVLDVVGLVVVVVDGGVDVVGGVVVDGRVVVVVPPGPGVVGGGDAGPVVPGGLVGPTVVPALRGTAAPGAATAPVSGASVETWREVDGVPEPEPRMLLKASSWEVMERSQFTSRGSSPPLNHLRARMKSPQRSVSSRTLGRNPTAMLTAAMSNRSAAWLMSRATVQYQAATWALVAGVAARSGSASRSRPRSAPAAR